MFHSVIYIYICSTCPPSKPSQSPPPCQRVIIMDTKPPGCIVAHRLGEEKNQGFRLKALCIIFQHQSLHETGWWCFQARVKLAPPPPPA